MCTAHDAAHTAHNRRSGTHARESKQTRTERRQTQQQHSGGWLRRRWSLSAPLLLLLLLSVTIVSAQPQDGPAQSVLLNSDTMRWVSLSANSTSAGATCNDRSEPGFWASLSTPDAIDPTMPPSLADLATAGTTVTWSRRWVIYLESGGACVDAYSCELRAWETPHHVTSYNSSRTKQAANLLSASEELNPTAFDHHHVFAHYCSSDFWLGRQSGAAANATVSPYAFQGAAIFRGLVRDLIAADTAQWMGSTATLRAPSLADATEIILVGSSAGGVGAVNHANWLRETVQAEQQARWNALNATAAATNTAPPPALQLAQVRLLIDSSWFVDYQNQVGTLSRLADAAWNMNGAVAPGQPEPLACASPIFNVLEVGSGADPAVAGVMCCFLANCVASTFLSPSIHLLVVQSLYDSFLLALGNSGLMGTLLPDLLPPGEQGVSATAISADAIERAIALVQLVSSYGGAYNTSMQLQRRSALVAAGLQGVGIYNLHFALLSCFNHMYLPHEIRNQIDGHEPFFNRVSDQSWTKVIVPRRGANGVNNASDERTLRDIIAHWHATTAMALPPLTHPLHYTDHCSQAQCNPTCPDFVSFKPSSLSDQISSSRLFHTNAMWHFVLKIVCLTWLFFPALLQLMVWAWSVCTRGRSMSEMQLLALASPLSPVQRRRKRGPNTLHRYPSIMSTNAMSLTQKGLPAPEEDEELAAEMARKAMVHFSFLALYYWPAPIEGPAKTVPPHTSKASLLRESPFASKHPASHQKAASQSQQPSQQRGGAQVAQQPQPARPSTPTDLEASPATAFVIVQSSPSLGPRQPPSVTQRFDESVRRPNGKVGDATSTNNSSGSSLRKGDEEEAGRPGLNPQDSTVIDMESAFRTALEAVSAEEAEDKRKAVAAAAVATPHRSGLLGSPRRGGYVRRVASSVEMTGVMPTASPSPPPEAGTAAAASSSAASAALPTVAPFVAVLAVPQDSSAAAAGSAAITSAVPIVVVSEKPPLPRLKSSLKEKPQQSPVSDNSGDEGAPPLTRARTKKLGAASVSFRTAEMMVKTAAEQAVDRDHDMAEMRAASGLPLESFTKLTQPLLKGVNGRFSSGQMIALMGKSGCGKSTLLELLACRRTFGMTHGTMFINGQPLQECMGWMKSSVGFVSQYGSSAVPSLSVLDNLLYAAKLRLPLRWNRNKKLARVQTVMDMCGLGPMKHTLVGSNEGDKGGLSGGQRRRVALAIELLAAPRLLMLDEITSGLDASSALEILLVLHSIVESTNMCCVLSIHQPRVESWGLFHQVLVLDAGHVIFQGAPFAALHEFTQGIIEASAWGLAKRDSEKLLKISSAAFENKQPGQDSSQNVNVADFLLDCLKYPAIGRSMQQRYERVYRNEIVDLIEHGIQEAVKIDPRSRPGTPMPMEALASVKAPPIGPDGRRKKTMGEIPVLARNRSIGEMPQGWQAAVLRGRNGGEAAPAASGGAPPALHRQRSMVDAPTLGRQRSVATSGDAGPASMQRQKSTGDAPPLHRQRSAAAGDAPPGIMRTRTMAHKRTASTAGSSSAKPILLRAVAPKVTFFDSVVKTLLNVATLESRRLHALARTPIELVKMPCFFLFLGTVLPAFFFLRISSALDTATWFVLLTNISNHMACTPLTFTFFDSMPLYNKERLSGAVTPLQHLVALSLHVSTFAILASNLGWIGGFLISTPATWSMISWSNMLDQILLECMCMRCFTFLYSLLVSVGYPKITLETTTMLAAFSVSFFFVFSGFLVAPRLIPPYLLWVLYINPMYWAFGAIVKVRIVELISLSDAAAAARAVTSSTGSSCAEGVSGWQCLLFQIPSFDTHGDSPMTTKLVLTTYDLSDIDVYASLFILLLMSVFFAAMSWLFLAAPWRVLAPVECGLHEEQIALAAAYREEELVKEFEAKQMQVKLREVEYKRVQQAAVEDASILHSMKSKVGVSGDLTNAFALKGAARWAAIIRQRLYGGGSAMLLEMEEGADQLTSELSDPLLMKRYAQARAQAQIQQREMNEWNRKLLEQQARVQVLRGDSPSPTNSRQGSRAGTPQTSGMRHRRNISNMGSGGGRMSPVTHTSVAAPSYMRAGVGAALGMEPARPMTPEASAPSMAILVSQMLQQRRAGRRATMELKPPGMIGNSSPGKPDDIARSPSGSQMGAESAAAGGGVTPALSRAATNDHLAIRTVHRHSPSPSSHMVTHNAFAFSSPDGGAGAAGGGPVSPIPVYPVPTAVFIPSSGSASPYPQRLGSPSGVGAVGAGGGAVGVSGGVFLPSSDGDATLHLPSEFAPATPTPDPAGSPSFFLPPSSPDGSSGQQ